MIRLEESEMGGDGMMSDDDIKVLYERMGKVETSCEVMRSDMVWIREKVDTISKQLGDRDTFWSSVAARVIGGSLIMALGAFAGAAAAHLLGG